MKTSTPRCLFIALLLLQTGCASMTLNDWASDGNNDMPETDITTLATIQKLIKLQPGQDSVQISFQQDSTSLDREDLQVLREWLTKPVHDVEVKVGPVRHENIITAIAISRERGLRVSRMLNAFRIPVRVTYDPALPLNIVEVVGWL